MTQEGIAERTDSGGGPRRSKKANLSKFPVEHQLKPDSLDDGAERIRWEKKLREEASGQERSDYRGQVAA